MGQAMTFEQFQATRRWSDDLANAVQSTNWESHGTPQGFLYLGCLYIEAVQPHWPAEARRQGRWHLLLGRCERIGDDLTTLERQLYGFAASEGYFES